MGQSGEKKFGFGLSLRLDPGLNMTEAVSVQERVLGWGWGWGGAGAGLGLERELG